MSGAGLGLAAGLAAGLSVGFCAKAAEAEREDEDEGADRDRSPEGFRINDVACDDAGMKKVWRVAGWVLAGVALAWPAGLGGVEAARCADGDGGWVSRIVVAPLKGGKEEYYPDGTETVDCSVSGFVEAGVGACWWVRRGR